LAPTLPDQTLRRVARGGYDASASALRSAGRAARCRGRHEFVDRRTRATTVIVILAGYKQALWPAVFPRLEKNIPPDTDVCLMSAGKDDAELRKLAATNGWSYLTTYLNDVSLIQNLAISHHPDADTIVKIDEDVLLPDRTIADLVDFHDRVKAAGVVSPAFTAPTLNINGFCYRELLRVLGLLDEYERTFGPARVATRGIAATESAEAARWIWERTGPVDRTASVLRGQDPEIRTASVQFSIGLIVFDRSFWETIGYFPVFRRCHAVGKSTLGADEEYLCGKAVSSGSPMVVAPHLFAGHFSFGRQYDGVLDLLHQRPELFS
jgi:hypothetical protein